MLRRLRVDRRKNLGQHGCAGFPPCSWRVTSRLICAGAADPGAGPAQPSTLDQIDATQRDLDAAIIAKDRLKAEHGEVFVYTARDFESKCRLAGMRELAAKVRPSERQPGRREVEEGENPPPPTPEPEEPEAVNEEGTEP